MERHEVISTKYFAYGSNMDPNRMGERDVHFSQRRHAILEGYALKFNKVLSNNPREGYANIVQKKDEIVEGVLYEVPELDMKKLDRREGFPTHYSKESVIVELDDHTKETAVTYVAQPGMIREGLKPTKEYLNHLLAAKDMLSDAYIQKLRLVETLD